MAQQFHSWVYTQKNWKQVFKQELICKYSQQHYSQWPKCRNNPNVHQLMSGLTKWGISVCVCVCSVLSNSLWLHGLWPARLLCPWNFSGKNTWVGCHFFLHGIFPNERQNPCLLSLLHWQADSLPLHHLGSLAYLYNGILFSKKKWLSADETLDQY